MAKQQLDKTGIPKWIRKCRDEGMATMPMLPSIPDPTTEEAPEPAAKRPPLSAARWS
jgi:hypothetical protein